MLTCTFLFDYPIIDSMLYSKLLNTILQVVKYHNEIEFLFTNASSESLCLAAVLEARQRHPGKHIYITLVARTTATELLSRTDYHTFPTCAVDRILVPPITVKSPRYFNVAHESLQIWAIDHADYIISYYYHDLNYSNRVFEHARNADLVTFNLIEPATVEYIQQEISRLPPDEQRIKTAIQQGQRLGDIGAQLERSVAAIRARHAKIIRKLRTAAQRRATKPSVVNDTSQIVTCSLIGFDDTTVINPKQIQSLTQTVRYLIKRFNVFLFIVEQSMCESPLVRAVVDLLRPNVMGDPDTKIIVMAHCPPKNKSALLALEQQYVPPFFSIMPVNTKVQSANEQTRRLLTTLLLQSDFAICNGCDDHAQINTLLASVNVSKPCKLKVLDISGITEEIMG